MARDLEKLRIHFFYVVVILVVGIILVSTYQWTTLKDFTSYLSNAATMTSLVLGLVAIFYSFISNDGLSKGLGNISDVADDVKQSKEQIEEFLRLTERSTETAGQSARSIENVSEVVTTSLENLRDTLDAIKVRTETLASLQGQFSRLEDKVDAIKPPGQKSNELRQVAGNVVFISDDGARYVVRASALSINMLTYACVLSKKSGVGFSIFEFSKIVNYNHPMYFIGYLHSWRTIGLVKIADFGSGSSVDYRITDMHPILFAETTDYLRNYIERSYANDSEKLEGAREQINRLEALFSGVAA